MLKKFAKQFSLKKAVKDNCPVTSPYENSEKTTLLKHLTKQAVKLYERKTDIKKFTELALSDPENLSHNDRVKEILDKEKDDLFDLTNNEKFLKDLGLQ